MNSGKFNKLWLQPYTEHCSVLMKESKENLNKCRDEPSSWISSILGCQFSTNGSIDSKQSQIKHQWDFERN